MTTRSSIPLKVGYLWQSRSADLSKISATTLHIKAVVEGFERRGHEVRLVTFQNGQARWTPDRINWQRADLGIGQSRLFRSFERIIRGIQSRLRLPYFNLFDSYRFAEACVSTLKECDILYERYWPLNYGGLIAAKRLGIPLVLEINGELTEEYAQLGMQLSKAQWAAISLIVRLMFRYADHSIAVGEQIKAQMTQRWQIDPANVSVIINGTDYDLFATPRSRQQIQEKFHLREGITLIFVGGFQPWHGVDVLVKAFRQVYDTHLDARLLLVGDGPQRAEIAQLAEQLDLGNAVHFLGKMSIEHVADLLAVADIAAAPYCHRQETIGMKLFDYMAAGKAIVITGENRQNSVIQHLHTGLVVEPGNVEELAHALLNLVEDRDLRRRLGQNAQIQAKSAHSWDNTVAKIESLCMNLLAQRGRFPVGLPAYPSNKKEAQA
jgi:glycosyltransferase involved in cell wall biosynthesis